MPSLGAPRALLLLALLASVHSQNMTQTLTPENQTNANANKTKPHTNQTKTYTNKTKTHTNQTKTYTKQKPDQQATKTYKNQTKPTRKHDENNAKKTKTGQQKSNASLILVLGCTLALITPIAFAIAAIQRHRRAANFTKLQQDQTNAKGTSTEMIPTPGPQPHLAVIDE